MNCDHGRPLGTYCYQCATTEHATKVEPDKVSYAFDSFQGTDITFRPLHGWPGKMTPADARRRSIFGKTTVTSTIKLLRHEINQIRARDPLISLAINERDIKRDGYPRADARPAHPGVIISFDTQHGRLVYKCDTFDHWHWNIRAIALTLEALRKPDRYGVLNAGEQYSGNRMLTAGGTKTTMNVRAAAEFMARQVTSSVLPFDTRVEYLIHDANWLDVWYREASKQMHPDRGGTPEQMDLLTKARDTLRAHHGLTGETK